MPAKKKTAKAKKNTAQTPKKKTPKKSGNAASSKKAAPKKAASKKSASKKSASKKTASKKTTPKAEKASTKKVASKKSASRTGAGKKSGSAKGGKKKLAKGANKSGKAKRDTPILFKSAAKRNAPAAFTLENVREILKKRETEGPGEEAPKPAKKKNTEKAEAAAPATDAAEPEMKNSFRAAASLDDILGLSSPARTGNQNIPPKYRKYYDILIQLREEVREELNQHSNDTLKRSQKEDSGEISTSSDAGTDTFDRDFALSLLSSEQEALNEIEAAIQRLERGQYGICEITGEPISEERLDAVPFTRFSLEGQRQHESTARKRVQRSGAFLNESSGDKITFGDDDGES